MRIVYVAPFLVNYGTEQHVARGFEEIGVDVTKISEAGATLAQIEEAADGAALVLYTRTFGLGAWAPDAVRLWRTLEQRGVATASFHLDLYCGLARAAEVSGENPFWATGTVFTADGDPASQEFFASRGVRHVWLPPAIAADEAVPGIPLPEFAHDVVFVGGGASYGHGADWPWRRRLVEFLHDRYGRRFAQYGTGGEHVRGSRLNDLYASVKVAVGDSLCLCDGPGGRRHENYWSDRITETLGRGGPLIFPDVPGLRDCYGLRHVEHALFYEYDRLDQVEALTDWAVANPDWMRAMAERARVHLVAAGHTYSARAETILGNLGLLGGRSSDGGSTGS